MTSDKIEQLSEKLDANFTEVIEKIDDQVECHKIMKQEFEDNKNETEN